MPQQISKIAKEQLTRRYFEQLAIFPNMKKDVSLELYLKRNIKSRINNLLKHYLKQEKLK